MRTLVNDFLGFKDLMSEHCGTVNIAVDYFNTPAKDIAQQLTEKMDKINGEIYLCDGQIKQAAINAGVAFKDVLELFKDATIEHSFSGFNVAIYEGYKNLILESVVAKSGAKKINFASSRYENGSRYLGFDSAAAYRQAAHILLDAYDNGADFLLVDDISSMNMFDACSADLSAVSNRDFSDFYILTSAEFIALFSGKTPKSLSSHKLKVRLV